MSVKKEGDAKQASITARQLTSLLAMAVEEAADGVVITDLGGTIEYVNPAYLDITGYRVEELQGKPVSVLRSGEHSEDHFRKMWEMIKRGRPWRGRLINRRKDGSLFEEEASIFAIFGADGQPTHFGSIKRLLRQRYVTDELLGHAQKLEAVAQLATGVAHDFNNQLTVILSSLQYLLETLDVDHPGRAAAKEIHQAGVHAAELTGHLLAFTRQQVLRPALVSAADLRQRIEHMARLSAPDTVSVSVVTGDGEATVRLDTDKFLVALDAVIENSIQAMPEGGELTISLNAIRHPSIPPTDAFNISTPMLRICVQDSGEGMEQSTRQRAIEPFFTTKGGAVRGLGLSIAWGIARQSGGSLRVESRLGSGTVVSFFFPLR